MKRSSLSIQKNTGKIAPNGRKKPSALLQKSSVYSFIASGASGCSDISATYKTKLWNKK